MTRGSFSLTTSITFPLTASMTLPQECQVPKGTASHNLPSKAQEDLWPRGRPTVKSEIRRTNPSLSLMAGYFTSPCFMLYLCKTSSVMPSWQVKLTQQSTAGAPKYYCGSLCSSCSINKSERDHNNSMGSIINEYPPFDLDP